MQETLADKSRRLCNKSSAYDSETGESAKLKLTFVTTAEPIGIALTPVKFELYTT
jgi:hypothetical protein